MKTSIKILLLILFSIGAVAGVLIYMKTRVAPPSNIELKDQYADNLKSSYAAFDAISDFDQSRAEYIRLDDLLKRYLSEAVIDNNLSDDYRKKIDDTYGRNLIAYGFAFFQNSVWPDDKLKELLSLISLLKYDYLSTGEPAVNDEFIASAEKINGIVDDYKAALRLSDNKSFKSVKDAKSKIDKARAYIEQDYLKNNAALVSALRQLPARIAENHYKHVEKQVDRLGDYENLSESQWVNIKNEVESVMDEYRNTAIYDLGKPSMENLVNEERRLLNKAKNYYEAEANESERFSYPHNSVYY